MTEQPLLSVENLVTSFRTEAGVVRAVDRVNLTVRRGKTLAIVGESGCGKSVTALSLIRLIPENTGKIESGHIRFKGEDILALSKDQVRKIRGNRISMIFQEPMTALNPVYTVGQQIGEVFKIHKGLTGKAQRDAVLKMLDKVKIPDPERRIDEYPFQLSGGMRQRVMIAMALACEPELLIADEPTTALDVTIQAQILHLMKNLQRDHGTAIVFITHDLGVVANMADDVAIMYAGRVAEQGSVQEIFANPQHPYTKGLMASIPSVHVDKKTRLSTIKGTVPSLARLPDGCRFNNRCPHAHAACFVIEPQLLTVGNPGHSAACHLIHEPTAAQVAAAEAAAGKTPALGAH